LKADGLAASDRREQLQAVAWIEGGVRFDGLSAESASRT
jgi:hypothetical protein